MKINEVGEGLIHELDKAANGALSRIQEHCQEHGYEGHITVETHLESLAEGEMLLLIQVFDGDQTTFFTSAKLKGSAQVLGWNLYLTERCNVARQKLSGADKLIDKVALDEMGIDPEEDVSELFLTLKRSLGENAAN